MVVVKPVEVLEAATQLIAEQGLCKEAYAVDADDNVVSAFSPIAARFCCVGAIQRAAYDLCEEDIDPTISMRTFRLLSPFMEVGLINQWSDGSSDREVIAVMRAACANARSLE